MNNNITTPVGTSAISGVPNNQSLPSSG